MIHNTHMPLKIAVIDDHRLYRSGLVNLIHSLGEGFKVVMEESNGLAFLNALKAATPPDIVILDIDMPVMNGFETAEQLALLYPTIPILVVTMLEDENSVIRMLRNGVKGFLSKDVEPEELKEALLSIAKKGYHYSDLLTGKLIQALQQPDQDQTHGLNERELEFLKLCCTELTYKEIADTMCLSPKTIDGYRGLLFEKIGVKSRVGLVVFAIKSGLVEL